MRKQLRWLIFPLAMLFLFVGTAFQEGSALTALEQATTPTFIPSDRLLQPTLPADPSQADIGAQDYWLNCLVCHGDYGQGLTDEFRAIYPPEEQYCWQSGCHGDRPYADGFTLPTSIPPVIGPNAALAKFANGSVLYAFISAAMPWHLPGSLEPDVYWRLTAFLLRENGYENPYEELGPDNAAFIPIGGDVNLEDIQQATPHPTAIASGDSMNMQQRLINQERSNWLADSMIQISLALLGAVVIIFVLIAWVKR